MRLFTKILIANRGEIACRIIRTCQRLKIKTLVCYTPSDANSLFVSLADEAYPLKSNLPANSYLNVAKIVSLAKHAKVNAVHPGYGFLSESSALARQLSRHHITFIGPSLKALRLMGAKDQAKALVETLNVPLIPGYYGQNQNATHLKKQAQKIGYPLLIKAALGGGGIGLATVEKEQQFIEALKRVRLEAKNAFNEDHVILEKLISHPRHIEVQIARDSFGNSVHLFERDCSLQRHHQKIIEETPALNLSPQLKKKLYQAALKIADNINYQGLGTVEFLVEGSQFYFLEMNTRLQVEHPITELVTGLDLVEWQLKIAAKEPLPLSQKQIKIQGHAFEARLYSEDVHHTFLPQSGTINYFQPPNGKFIRLDSGIRTNDLIPRFYDTLLAKICAWGKTREQSLLTLSRALNHTAIGPIKTNLNFLSNCLQMPAFKKGTISTSFVEDQGKKLLRIPLKEELQIIGALALHLGNSNLPTSLFGWQLTNNKPFTLRTTFNGDSFAIKVYPLHHGHKIKVNKRSFNIQLLRNTPSQIILYINGTLFECPLQFTNNHLTFLFEKTPYTFAPYLSQTKEPHLENSGHLQAPLPGEIMEIKVKQGSNVEKGEDLIVLEAMKVYHTLQAPFKGVVKDIPFPEHATVSEGDELIVIDQKGVD